MHVYIPLETSSVRLTFSFRKGKTMKKRSKKLVAILSAILVAASALAAVPVSAYWLPSQNREILYYDFDFGNQLTHYGSEESMERLYDREWAVTVSAVNSNRYAITYGILSIYGTEWYASICSYTVSNTGTGNFGSTYYSNETVGKRLHFGAYIDNRDMGLGVTTSGQWSTDAQA